LEIIELRSPDATLFNTIAFYNLVTFVIHWIECQSLFHRVLKMESIPDHRP